ncbi:MAG: YdcF family protein [Acidobacteriota bacterium]|nr:YdcF family protein [Acidobacteriota bacterium]
MSLAAAGVLAALVFWAVVALAFAPHTNTQLNRYDAIIVLGDPADSDGNPTPQQLARVNEGVREYERSVAPRLIMTGGPAHNHFVEAEVMARAAAAQGIPASQILVEPRALDTIQNACYAVRIMKEHGWKSAEVVSSAGHLPRAAMIFEKTGIDWRTHAAPPLEPESGLYKTAVSVVETIKTMRYLIYAQWAEKCTP